MANGIVALLTVLTILRVASQPWPHPLRFRADGTFKIVEVICTIPGAGTSVSSQFLNLRQVSDTHYTRNPKCNDLSPSQQRFPCSDDNATAFWRKLAVEEDPDLFLFTGDNICGGDAAGGADAIEGFLADWAPGGPNAHIPWAAVEGNHDGESGLSYAQVAKKLLAMPNGVNMQNPSFLSKEIYGNTNFLLKVFGVEASPDAEHIKLSLYMVDSNSYSSTPGVDGYDWVHNPLLVPSSLPPKP